MSLSDRITRGSSKGCACRACDAVSTYSHSLCWLCIEHAGMPHPAEDRPAVTLPRCYKCGQAIRAHEYLSDGIESRHIVCPAPRGMTPTLSPFTRRALAGTLPAKIVR